MAEGDKPASPLDAERARLRQAGYTEEEIKEYFVERLRHEAPQSADPPPIQGNMSGVLGNATAAVSYGRAAIFGIRGDIRNLFNTTAPALERAMSGGILAFKLIVVAVVCFALYQEWQRHVIFETEVAKEQAAAAHTKSCDERAQSGVITLTNRDSPAYKQYLAECADFFPPPPPPPKFENGKDEYDAISDERVLSEFESIEPKFIDLTHTDGNKALRLCTYRAALRLMSHNGYDKVDAVRTAIDGCLPRDDQFDTMGADQVLSNFANIDSKFKELTHLDASPSVKECIYRQAFREIAYGGYTQEIAVRMAAMHTHCSPDGGPSAAKP